MVKGAAAAVAGRLIRIPRIVPFFVLSIPARMRRRLAVALLVAAVLSGVYFFWLRDSSLVAIERVQVSGLTTRDAPKVREALTSAARDMTTLHVDRERLLEAAAAWPVVNELRVTTDFPHGVRIEAVERRPVALVGSGGDRLPVSEDGTVLRGLRGKLRLPEVDKALVGVAGAAPPGAAGAHQRNQAHRPRAGGRAAQGPRRGPRLRRPGCAPSGPRLRRCWPTRSPRARSTWTCGCPSAPSPAASLNPSPRRSRWSRKFSRRQRRRPEQPQPQPEVESGATLDSG